MSSEAIPALHFTLLFGSRAHGRLRPGSDVDVAIMLRGDLFLASELDLRGRLARALGAEGLDALDAYARAIGAYSSR